MIRCLTTVFIVNVLLFTFFAVPLRAQSNTTSIIPAERLLPTVTPDRRDLANLLTDDRKFDPVASSAAFDPVAADAVHHRQQAKKGWSTGQKVAVAAVIVGIAALVFVLVKYGKDCARSTPPGCTPGVDEFCTCEEYERRIPK